VIDMALWQPGHVATQLLADLGATVVKVEPPGGDRMRPQGEQFSNFNGRKRSEVVDLKSADGRARLFALVGRAEVIVENFRPGVADRLGVGFAVLRAVNPAIVMCSITGFGQDGPLANVGGHDHNYQAYAGAFTFVEGGAPRPAGLLVGDQGGGLAAAFAILAAVLCARRTGEGEHIDVALADLLVSWVAPGGPVDPRYEDIRRTVDLPGMGPYATSDGGFVELGVFSEDHLWDQLCRALGLDGLVGIDMAGRSERGGEMRAALQATIGARKRDELVAALTPLGVPVAPILTRDEMLTHPNVWARGVLTVDEHGYRRVAHPIHYAVHPSLPPGDAPELDADRGRGFD
jgi:crotonobetainyl-CoA:carnitine CoA-transferase CaiB-like acyl-CoA transferase